MGYRLTVLGTAGQPLLDYAAPDYSPPLDVTPEGVLSLLRPIASARGTFITAISLGKHTTDCVYNGNYYTLCSHPTGATQYGVLFALVCSIEAADRLSALKERLPSNPFSTVEREFTQHLRIPDTFDCIQLMTRNQATVLDIGTISIESTSFVELWCDAMNALSRGEYKSLASDSIMLFPFLGELVLVCFPSPSAMRSLLQGGINRASIERQIKDTETALLSIFSGDYEHKPTRPAQPRKSARRVRPKRRP